MNVRNCVRAFFRGFFIAFAQTALFVVGVPLALLVISVEWLAERISEVTHWVFDKSEELSHWRRESLLRDVEQDIHHE